MSDKKNQNAKKWIISKTGRFGTTPPTVANSLIYYTEESTPLFTCMIYSYIECGFKLCMRQMLPAISSSNIWKTTCCHNLTASFLTVQCSWWVVMAMAMFFWKGHFVVCFYIIIPVHKNFSHFPNFCNEVWI